MTVTNNGSLAQFYDVDASAAPGNVGDTLHTVLAVQADYTATCTPATVLPAAVPLNGASLVAARPLAAAANESLCVRISFPDGGIPAPSLVAGAEDGDNVFQGDDADVTLTFTATQRAGIAS